METLEIRRGDDHPINFTYKDADGVAIDITGYTIYLTAKAVIDDDVTDAEAVISKDVTSHSDPTNGLSVISLSNTETNLGLGDYLADIQIKNGSNELVSSGLFIISIVADVTRRAT